MFVDHHCRQSQASYDMWSALAKPAIKIWGAAYFDQGLRGQSMARTDVELISFYEAYLQST